MKVISKLNSHQWIEASYRGVTAKKRYANSRTPLQNHYEVVRRLTRLLNMRIPDNLFPLYIDERSAVWVIPEEEYAHE